MKLETIRQEIDSPGWLTELSKKYRRDAKKNELRKAEVKQKDLENLAEKIATKLGKQDSPVETVVVSQPPAEDSRSQRDLILALTEALESLSDRVDTLEQGQTRKTDGRTAITHSQPSQLDLEVIQSRFEAVGLTGEIRKVLPFEVIGGRFSG